MPPESYFWTLLSRKIAGEATDKELKELDEMIVLNAPWQLLHDEMMKKHETGQGELDEAEQMYAALSVQMQLKSKATEEQQLYQQNLRSGSHFSKRRIYLAASAVAACFLVLTLFQWDSLSGKAKDPVVKSNEVATRKGSKSKISLPDGTQVWLNADTRLTYSNDFMSKQREVYLTGEAFFDVAHNEKRPFIIHANRIDIKVLGTAFNVRNYPQDEFVETSLIRGKIEVNFRDRPDEKITLHPNEKLTINNRGIAPGLKKDHPSVDPAAKVTINNLTPLLTDSTVAEIAWMSDEFVFTNDTMEQIALELERRYNVTIVFKDEAVKRYRYSAVFGAESIDKILDVIVLSRKFNYTIDGKKVTISK